MLSYLTLNIPKLTQNSDNIANANYKQRLFESLIDPVALNQIPLQMNALLSSSDSQSKTPVILSSETNDLLSTAAIHKYVGYLLRYDVLLALRVTGKDLSNPFIANKPISIPIANNIDQTVKMLKEAVLIVNTAIVQQQLMSGDVVLEILNRTGAWHESFPIISKPSSATNAQQDSQGAWWIPIDNVQYYDMTSLTLAGEILYNNPVIARNWTRYMVYLMLTSPFQRKASASTLYADYYKARDLRSMKPLLAADCGWCDLEMAGVIEDYQVNMPVPPGEEDRYFTVEVAHSNHYSIDKRIDNSLVNLDIAMPSPADITPESRNGKQYLMLFTTGELQLLLDLRDQLLSELVSFDNGKTISDPPIIAC